MFEQTNHWSFLRQHLVHLLIKSQIPQLSTEQTQHRDELWKSKHTLSHCLFWSHERQFTVSSCGEVLYFARCSVTVHKPRYSCPVFQCFNWKCSLKVKKNKGLRAAASEILNVVLESNKCAQCIMSSMHKKPIMLIIYVYITMIWFCICSYILQSSVCVVLGFY